MKQLKTSISVCEYNPFHNGHKLHIEKMKQNSDAVAVIMSGNFCQRGEAAIADKYTRAEWAIKSGADIVFELPAVFSVAPAEIFACGAIKLIDSIPGKKTLFFGAESGLAEDFLQVASVTLNETKQLKEVLKQKLSGGAPYALARAEAYKEVYPEIDFSLLDSPNSILGVEYTKAIIKSNSKTTIQPVLRNVPFNSTALEGDVCSAAAIRNAISDGKKKKTRNFVPDYVFQDLPDRLPEADKIMLFSLLEAKTSDLKLITDCTEGLENRLKTMVTSAKNLEDFIDRLETRRYTRARLRRIICANTLHITREFQEQCLKSNLYLKVLAVAADKTFLLSQYSDCKNKLITRKSDTTVLKGTKLECFKKDVYANDVYNLISGKHTNEYEMKIIKR